MTLQEQYNAIKDGKGNKTTFLKEAKRNHSNIISNVNSYNDAVSILKSNQVINENTYYADLQPITQLQPSNRQPFEKAFATFLEEQKKKDDEAVKIEEKKPAKHVEEVNSHNFDYKDSKNMNNQIGQEVLNGIYCEVQKDPKITQEAAMKTVMKNLAKDKLYYVKEGQFGIEGLGYKEQKSEMATGNHKASGYSDKIGEAVDQVLKEGLGLGGVVTTAHPDSMASRQNAFVKQMMDEEVTEEEVMKELDSKEIEEVEGMTLDQENDYAEEMSNDMPGDEHTNHMEEEEIMDGEPESEIKEKMKSKKKTNSLQARMKEIESVGTTLALEAKIEALDEEIFERTQRLEMLDENDAMSSLVDPKKVKMIRNEIKLLEKTKKRYAKMHEKASKQSKKGDE